MSGFSLVKAFGLIRATPLSPCEQLGGCHNRQRCAEERLSCFAFGVYVSTGRNPGFDEKTDAPTAEMFDLQEQDLNPFAVGEESEDPAPRMKIRLTTLHKELQGRGA